MDRILQNLGHQGLYARQFLAFHPLQESAASGRDEAEIARHARMVGRRHGVDPPATDVRPHSLVSAAASFARATVALSKGALSNAARGHAPPKVRHIDKQSSEERRCCMN